MTTTERTESPASAGRPARPGEPAGSPFATREALLYAAAVVLAAVSARALLPENPAFVHAWLVQGAIGGSVWMAVAFALSRFRKEAVGRWLLAILLLGAAANYVPRSRGERPVSGSPARRWGSCSSARWRFSGCAPPPGGLPPDGRCTPCGTSRCTTSAAAARSLPPRTPSPASPSISWSPVTSRSPTGGPRAASPPQPRADPPAPPTPAGHACGGGCVPDDVTGLRVRCSEGVLFPGPETRRGRHPAGGLHAGQRRHPGVLVACRSSCSTGKGGAPASSWPARSSSTSRAPQSLHESLSGPDRASHLRGQLVVDGKGAEAVWPSGGCTGGGDGTGSYEGLLAPPLVEALLPGGMEEL